MAEDDEFLGARLTVSGKAFLLRSQIGSGAFGKIYLGADPDGREVVVKLVTYSHHHEHLTCIFNELSCLRELRGAKVASLLDFALLPEERLAVFVLEKADMDLDRFIFSSKSHLAFIPKWRIKSVFREILEGVQLLHQHCIVHRDLKPGNILLSAPGRDCKLIDFGYSERLDPFDERPLQTYLGTSFYRAPELIVKQRLYSASVDVWSLGCIFAEMFQRRPLFFGLNDFHVLLSICQKLGTPDAAALPESDEYLDFQMLPKFERRSIRDSFPGLREAHPQFRDEDAVFLRKMLAVDPNQRLTVRELLRLPYMRGDFGSP